MTCGYTVSQWTIYDAYTDDLLSKERSSKDKARIPPPNTKGHKDDDKASLAAAEPHAEDIYYKNTDLAKMMVIMERMANQNTFDDISQDFKYWEDASDELGDRKCTFLLSVAGRLLPLWNFVYMKEKKKQVTSVCWSPKFPDLFVVGYGSYDFSHQGPGLIACFTLKNPSHPELTFTTDSGVMCLHLHPQVFDS